MRNLVTKILLLGVIWAITPGLTEVVENLWHFAAAGHSAHAIEEGSDHVPENDEHGCTATFHLCSCHQAQSLTLSTGPASLSAVFLSAQVAQLQQSEPSSPNLPDHYRPPRV